MNETTVYNESFDETVLSENDIYVNYFIKETKKKKSYDILEREGEKYGYLESRHIVVYFPVGKILYLIHEIKNLRKGRKIKRWWLKVYANTKVKAVKQEHKCCKCRSFAQRNREKIDNKDNADTSHLRNMDEKQKRKKKQNNMWYS